MTEEILRKHILEKIEGREQLIQTIVETCMFREKKTIIKGLKTFFTEAGLHQFMNTGLIEAFPYPVYTPLTMEERCCMIRKCIKMSNDGRNRYYMIKDDELMKLKNIHIEYVINDDYSCVRFDVNNNQNGIERLHLADENIIGGFEHFFECLENEKYVYSSEETDEKMLKIVKEYEERDREEER